MITYILMSFNIINNSAHYLVYVHCMRYIHVYRKLINFCACLIACSASDGPFVGCN